MRAFTLFGLGSRGDVTFARDVEAEGAPEAVSLAMQHLRCADRIELWEGPICMVRAARPKPQAG